MSVGQPLTDRARTRRTRLERGWYALSALYSVVRIILAQQFLGDYGLNVAAFAAIEFAATVPYAVGAAKLVGALADRNRRLMIRWGLVASGGFIAPDLFILVTTRHAPGWLYAVIIAWVLIAAGFGVHQIRSEARVRRDARRQATAVRPASDA